MKRPMLYWVILFILGEVLCRILKTGLMSVVMAGMTIGITVILLTVYKKNQMIILLGSVFFLLGVVCFYYTEKRQEYCKMLVGKQVAFCGLVKSVEVSDKGNNYLIGAAAINGENLHIHITLEIEENIELGSKITGTGEIIPFKKASNPGGYDEEGYQYGKGVFLSLENVTINEWRSPLIPVREGLFQLRKKLARIYEEVFDSGDASLAKAMVLGNKDSLDEDTKTLYQRNGIAHLLAISGLHIAMLGGTLYQLLRRLLGSYPAAAGAGILFIVLYGIMTGLSGATLRAVIMLALSIGADISGRRYDMLTAIAAALFFILLMKPYQITQAGFLLSFGAVIGIAVVNPVWKQIFKKLPHFLDGLMVSVSVQLVLLPIFLYYFYEIPLYGVFLNVLVIPAMSLLLASLVLCGIAGCVLLKAAFLFAKPAQWIFLIYEQLCILSEKLPLHTVCTGRPSIIWIAVYYSILAVFVAAGYKKKWIGEALSGSLFILLWLGLFLPGNLMICMFDVGQGDGIYIRTPERRHILIDGGSSSKQKVGTYVLKNGIKYFGGASLDYVFVSHSDGDHYSGILELLEDKTVSVRNFVLPAVMNPDEAYCELEQKARNRGCHIYYMKKGDKLLIDDVTFYCLNPERRRYEDKNQGSIVLWMTYDRFDMLFTGDMDEVIEKEIINQVNGKMEILKVAHHGSATASSSSFLEHFYPDAACISVGEKNQYGHPAREVMERLRKYCRNIYLTKNSGAITIDTDGKVYQIITYFEE